jgi:hypothetical protein
MAASSKMATPAVEAGDVDDDWEKEAPRADQAAAQMRAQTRMPAAIATGARSRRMARSYVIPRI